MAGEVAHLVECLPTLPKAWIQSPAPCKQSLIVHVCSPGTSGVEARGLEDQVHPHILNYARN